ncbi:MAG TPA: chloride channel protein [Mycobacteriales bacterium]|nr:chloride channel protein [Mycobacteriales bacterium]HWA66253.1 chloride channel protein [Mycobacteriales bacterium]
MTDEASDGEQLDSAATEVRDVSHLGDFSATPRLLLIAALALPIGAVSACVSWALLRLIGFITNGVFYHRLDTSLVAPDSHHHNPALVLLAPVAGGLVIGLMARYGSERIRGHGMPETIEAILIGGSRIQPRVAVLKPVSSAIAIGTGGPFGAEGPIIMTGGAIGSLFAQLLHLTADERKTLLVSGAAAGMAATFNTPLAAVLLAVELLLFEWRPRSYVPVASAVAVAAAVRRPLLGSGLLFPVHGALHITAVSYLLCVVSGVGSAILAVIATVLVYASEDGFRKLPIHWMWWPAIGGLIIGLGGLAVPQTLGVGYNVIDAELTGSIGLGLVAGVLVVKTLIWSLSLGSGTSGGVLAPMFMIGGALGTLEAHIFPSVGPGFWPLVALAGVLGGVMRSPFTGVVFAVELTGRFDAILPLLIGASVAFGASVLVLKRSVLTEKIARRGYHLSREYDVDPLETAFVGDVMSFDLDGLDGAPAVCTDDTLRQTAYVMAEEHQTRCAVVTRARPDHVIGSIDLADLLVGRRRDLHEMAYAERVIRVRLPGRSWRRS